MTDMRTTERLQAMLSAEELAALDDWRFAQRMPSRAAAIRELLRRGLGLAADGSEQASRRRSTDYRIVPTERGGKPGGASLPNEAPIVRQDLPRRAM
jgi:hypothetical protein